MTMMTATMTRASGTPPDVKAACTRRLPEGAIVPTLLTLAAPNILNLVALTVIVTADAFFVGWLGATALAGVALVFPLKMLMQHMAASGMGGAVTSAIARALGAGRRDHANALVVHALVIATAMAALFSTALLTWGAAIYAALGGRDEVLDAALTYSTVIFAGAITPWLFNTLASIVRGTGNMTLPAAVAGSALADLLLSPALLFGWGPFPRLGIAGPGSVSSRRSGSAVWSDTSCLVAPLGATTLAGYGVAARIEYVLIPLVFGFGTSLVTMVATNVGAGQRERAERIAWIGAGVVMAFTGTIGLVGAALPHIWMGLFTTDADVLAAGSAYLRIVGPAYGLYGFGAALYFGSQGFGRLMWPVLANIVRLLIAAGGGWLVTRWFGGGLHALFAPISAAFVIYGAMTFAAIQAGAWRR